MQTRQMRRLRQAQGGAVGGLKLPVGATVAHHRKRLPDPQRADVAFGQMRREFRRRCVFGTHRHLAGAKDAGLLDRDGLAAVAEPVAVIGADAGDQRGVGIEQVHRIQPPAQPDLQHLRGAAPGAKHPQGRQRAELEVGQRGVAALRLDGDEGLDDARRVHRLAIDHDALGIVVQVRRGELAHAVPDTLQQVGRQAGGRALAIGAADGQGQRRLSPQAQAVGDPGDPFEAQLNLVAVQAELPVQPLRKAGVSRRGGTRVGGHPVNQPSITARRSRWPARGRGS